MSAGIVADNLPNRNRNSYRLDEHAGKRVNMWQQKAVNYIEHFRVVLILYVLYIVWKFTKPTFYASEHIHVIH
jgi:hypothetical protein